MKYSTIAPLVAAIAIGCGVGASAQLASPMASPMASGSGTPAPMASTGLIAPGNGVGPGGVNSNGQNGMQGGGMHSGGMMNGSMGGMHGGMMNGMGPDHGMPAGRAGGDGAMYMGKPDLQAAISLVTAGGPPGNFSIAKAVASLAGPAVAKAEVAKLSKQYGSAAFTSFVTVQNFAVNDAVKHALAAGVKFPTPQMHGATLAKRVVGYGLIGGTYYEGYQLDHLVTNGIHEAVMNDIDAKYGKAADANYHRIADQAHYDLAQALGAKSVGLASFH